RRAAGHRPEILCPPCPRLCTGGRHHVGRRGIERERLVQTISWVWWVSPRLLSFLFGPFTRVRLPAPPQSSQQVGFEKEAVLSLLSGGSASRSFIASFRTSAIWRRR